jgi:hypothetical protein
VGDTTLAGEVTQAAGSRDAVSAATSANSKGVRFTGTFASVNSHNTTTVNISNIGLFQQSNTNTGTIFAGRSSLGRLILRVLGRPIRALIILTTSLFLDD